MFLDGYEEVAGAAGLASPRAEANGLIELFLLEKVLYELAYEIDHRPDWVRVPLRGLADILAAG
jgi:maltose alpha-D-glucosyltransferase/alpha-amylase